MRTLIWSYSMRMSSLGLRAWQIYRGFRQYPPERATGFWSTCCGCWTDVFILWWFDLVLIEPSVHYYIICILICTDQGDLYVYRAEVGKTGRDHTSGALWVEHGKGGDRPNAHKHMRPLLIIDSQSFPSAISLVDFSSVFLALVGAIWIVNALWSEMMVPPPP